MILGEAVKQQKKTFKLFKKCSLLWVSIFKLAQFCGTLYELRDLTINHSCPPMSLVHFDAEQVIHPSHSHLLPNPP